MRAGKISTGPAWRLTCAGWFALLLCFSATCWAGAHASGPRGAFRGPQSHEQHAPSPREVGPRQAAPRRGPGPAPGEGARPGQQHLPAWWQAHRGLPPQQQADALRREPGFRNLPPGQQQRLINRLHSFNQRPPEQQQRMMDRNEMFERLSPERQQEVRGASQALSRMSPERQAMMRHAFQQLRAMPPAQRQQMLNSSYGAQFSPQERTVLNNFLSVEPYQPHVIQPYFGR